MKLWELHHKLHCPVIGTCLHVDELRKLGQERQAAAERAVRRGR